MFLSVEYHHDKIPRGWSERLRCGTSHDTPAAVRKSHELLRNERPPYCNTSVKWRDAEGVFWTIEEWFIKELDCVGPVHVLKRDCEVLLVEGKILLPNMRSTQLPRKSFLDKAEWLVENVGMDEFDLAPSWFDIDFLKDQTIICQSHDGIRALVHASSSFRGVKFEDDHLHPVVRLK